MNDRIIIFILGIIFVIGLGVVGLFVMILLFEGFIDYFKKKIYKDKNDK